MWTLFEPVHLVTYFTPEGRAAFEEAGLHGFWRGYFAGRSAPLGPVGAAPVVAVFFGFAPAMVARALPDVWQRASPEESLAARERGAVAALTRLTADIPAEQVAEAADLLEAATDQLGPAGRVLGAANLALPRPRWPLARLWQAGTTLREHRGDGHNAALLAAGIDGCESLVLRAGQDLPREMLQAGRGWPDEEWSAAADRLGQRGWLSADGRATAAGVAVYQEVEAVTDRLAAAPWEALGDAATHRLAQLLRPVALACYAALPQSTPIGLPVPASLGASG
jgi:hypothetical protein